MFQCQATKDIVARPQLGRLLLPAAHGADSACAVTTRVARVARVPRRCCGAPWVLVHGRCLVIW
jgi:hypothetical protein